ncbi:CNP1-like family protein [Herbaspirillum sp. RTI4]|uniref:CNP1-like family protein n=1 Tax=Herbaspirillum sp. RTI4 TaxID=3048640 RepID=UPI002AB37068|nr:CNP1-like family protein [Herbaspirillum sp. RTI4]MDY7577507.1 CNP1-like family protein [Herbaspirillum sp. RTI4]MEA9980982.1 CNP1-like family protein [Herbaspirillum sp. RTI4]
MPPLKSDASHSARALPCSLPQVLRMILATGLLCSSGAFAAGSLTGLPGNLDEDFDDSSKSWQEISLQLPPAPQESDLASFYVDPRATGQSAVDAKSISIGTDGVIRYTMVVKTQGGAVNVSYNGIRCATYESKSYAFGRSDGAWSRARQDKWKVISNAGANRQDAVLFKEYFCDGTTIAGDLETIVLRFRNHQPMNSSGNAKGR